MTEAVFHQELPVFHANLIAIHPMSPFLCSIPPRGKKVISKGPFSADRDLFRLFFGDVRVSGVPDFRAQSSSSSAAGMEMRLVDK